MIREKYLLAAGSPAFSKKLAALFQSRGWQVEAITNKRNVSRLLMGMQIAPQYLVVDKLTDWIIQVSQQLHSQGTQIILSGWMTETPEELERILGVP